ncbi:TIGR03943 family putative permease subunit [Streptomyces sp. WMMC905]|uniref:TIGR03943 family putative permease subunit n=1 Tax=Streptomyces sp. WMMC905 TaxID=3404123 RepID=UPI003B928272
MNRWAQAAVLFVLGAALVRVGATDLSLRYVKAGLRPLVVASGAVLVATALATVRYERRRSEDGAAGDGDRGREDGPGDGGADRRPGADGGGRGGETGAAPRSAAPGSADGHRPHPEPRVSWLLLLPVLALVLAAPPALGSHSALNAGTAVQRPPAFPPLPDDGRAPLRMGLADYAERAVHDEGRTLDGRALTVTGFLAVDESGTPHLVRMTLDCCAADAQPIKVGLTGRLPPVLRPDTWLDVTGRYLPRRERDPVNGGPIPFLEVDSAVPVPQPRDPYDAGSGA